MKYLILLLISVMAYTLNCRIKIGNAEFTGVNDLVINHSVHQLVQTAQLRVPLSARLHYAGKTRAVKTHEVFKRGDPVNIQLGYNNQLLTEFEGYVTRIIYGTPLTIECEDAMHKLRQINISETRENITLKEIIDMCLTMPGEGKLYEIEGEVPDTTYYNFSFKDASAVEVLQSIKEYYNMAIFFTPQARLFVGGLYNYSAEDVKYNFHININPRRNELKFQEKEDVRIKIIAKSYTKNGDVIEASAGDEDGDIRTLWFYNIEDEQQLKERAESEIEKYRYTGYSGYFQTLLQPYAKPGMKAIIEDHDFPDRGGKYYISGVETRFGMSGASRKIEPEIRLDI